MRIISIEKIYLDNPTPVFDVVNASPNHNFLIKSSTSNQYIVSHNCGLLDEVDFVPGSDVKMQQSKIMKIYRNVKRRMESRFSRAGDLPAMLFMVSSKKSDHDFLEQYIDTIRTNPRVYVVDQPIWKVKKESYPTDKYFKVAVGNKYIKSRVLGPDDSPDAALKQGFKIIDVPDIPNLRQAFELDIDAALMDLAGISSTVTSKFISYERLRSTYVKSSKNPFKTSIIEIGINDDLQIKDFFIPDMVSEDISSMPIFIHIDTSLTGDRTGISAVAIMGKKKAKHYNKGEVVQVNELYYRHVFSIGIKCPSNSEISLEKNRLFIYYLKNELGYNIKRISLDGFQSADTKQQLLTAGFDAVILSLDKKPDGYMTFKAALNEKRVGSLYVKDLETEIINLERNNQTGKIDHPDNGSKDIADSYAGALWSASLYKEDYDYFYNGDSYEIADEVNTESDPQKEIISERDLFDKSDHKANRLPAKNPDQAIDEFLIQRSLSSRSKLKSIKSKLTPAERASVSDEELMDLVDSQEDPDSIIF